MAIVTALTKRQARFFMSLLHFFLEIGVGVVMAVTTPGTWGRGHDGRAWLERRPVNPIMIGTHRSTQIKSHI